MPNKQKLYIIRKEYDGFGGAENVAKRYATLLSEHYDVELIYGYKKAGYTFHGKYGPGWCRSLLFAISVSQFLKSQPDSLVFSMARGVAGSIFRAGDGVHKIWLKRKKTHWIRKYSNLNNWVAPYLERKSIEQSNFVVPNSEMTKYEITSEYPHLSNKKIKVIKNGFDQQKFNCSDKQICIESSISKINRKHSPIIFFCANGWERKGLECCIKLISVLKKRGSNANLWIAGKGDSKKFSKIAFQLNVEDRIHFLGSISNVEKWYQLSELFVLPTSYDPFSNSCLESLACGCPVITTSSNGASECVSKSNGMIINTPNELTEDHVIAWILDNIPMHRHLISQSVSPFTSEREISKYLEILKLIKRS